MKMICTNVAIFSVAIYDRRCELYISEWSDKRIYDFRLALSAEQWVWYRLHKCDNIFCEKCEYITHFR